MVPLQIHTTSRIWGDLPFSDATSSAGPPARRSNADDAEKTDCRRSFEECAVRHRSGFNMVLLQTHHYVTKN